MNKINIIRLRKEILDYISEREWVFDIEHMPFESFYISFLAKDFFTEEDWYNHIIHTRMSKNPNIKTIYDSYEHYQSALANKTDSKHKKAKTLHKELKKYDETLFYLKATKKNEFLDITLYNTPKNFYDFRRIEDYKILNGGLDIMHNDISTTADLLYSDGSYIETAISALTNIFMGTRSLLTEPKNYVIKEYAPSQKKSSGKSKIARRNTIYVNAKTIYINKPENLESSHRTFIRKTKSWTVSGHWRTLPSGKQIWIKPYVKGDKQQSPSDKTYVLSDSLIE